MKTFDPLIGLFAWIKFARLQNSRWVVSKNGVVALILTSRLANGFQTGLCVMDGQIQRPILAFNPDLWWFTDVWEHISVTSQALVLSAATTDPLLVVLPSDMPKSISGLKRALHQNVAPYSTEYLSALCNQNLLTRPSICRADDVQFNKSATVPNLNFKETPWLNELSVLSP